MSSLSSGTCLLAFKHLLSSTVKKKKKIFIYVSFSGTKHTMNNIEVIICGNNAWLKKKIRVDALQKICDKQKGSK